jgi:hypothetical protein
MNSLDVRRQKSVQAKVGSLLLRERRAFVQLLVVEEIYSAHLPRVHILHWLNEGRSVSPAYLLFHSSLVSGSTCCTSVTSVFPDSSSKT